MCCARLARHVQGHPGCLEAANVAGRHVRCCASWLFHKDLLAKCAAHIQQCCRLYWKVCCQPCNCCCPLVLPSRMFDLCSWYQEHRYMQLNCEDRVAAPSKAAGMHACKVLSATHSCCTYPCKRAGSCFQIGKSVKTRCCKMAGSWQGRTAAASKLHAPCSTGIIQITAACKGKFQGSTLVTNW
jgi:hypothetical protein